MIVEIIRQLAEKYSTEISKVEVVSTVKSASQFKPTD
jgi:hypothetical protein